MLPADRSETEVTSLFNLILTVRDRYTERTPLPRCLTRQVRLKYPSPTNTYTGFVGSGVNVPDLGVGIFVTSKP